MQTLCSHGGLKEIGELAHYSAIVGYCYYLNKSGTILDIGCGEGILQERLRSLNYSRYVGVDISAKAIRRASPGTTTEHPSLGQT